MEILTFNARIFDKDGKDDIDFTEFIIGCFEWQQFSIKKKLEFLFDIFDTDNAGFISLADILRVVRTLYINEGQDRSLAVERSTEIFHTFTNDVNSSKISRDHFVAVCMKHNYILTDSE